MTIREVPVRLCCGQRHIGFVCNDGMVMCCICFDRFLIEQLHLDTDGVPQDVCKRCASQQQVRSRTDAALAAYHAAADKAAAAYDAALRVAQADYDEAAHTADILYAQTTGDSGE